MSKIINLIIRHIFHYMFLGLLPVLLIHHKQQLSFLISNHSIVRKFTLHHAVCSYDCIAAQFCAVGDNCSCGYPATLADEYGGALLVGLLHDGHVLMIERVVIVANEYALRYGDVVLNYYLLSARDKQVAAYHHFVANDQF